MMMKIHAHFIWIVFYLLIQLKGRFHKKGRKKLGFSEIKPFPKQPEGYWYQQKGQIPKIEANIHGGMMELTINYKVGANQFCPARYRFDWRFLKPVSRLYKNQPLNVQYEVKLLTGACKAGTAKMIVHASAGFSPNYQRLGIRSGGLTVKPAKWLQVGSAARGQSHLATINAYNPSVQYGTIRINFESTGYVGSEKLHYEVVYVFQKNFSGTVASAPPSQSCSEGNWYREVESTHPWAGLTMHQIRQRGHNEAFYYGSMTWGWNYFLQDPRGRNVRVFGSRIFYVDWRCFEQHHSYVGREALARDRRLSHKDRWRRNKDGFEFEIIYVARS